jgi:hypothetical protein
MAVLLHGTTRYRARLIRAHGPDPKFVEPGSRTVAESFSTYLEQGPFLFGLPEEYACRKAADFPSEGGAAILAVDVPERIIALAINEWFPLSQGLVQFDVGAGLAELLAAWPTLSKDIRAVECP